MAGFRGHIAYAAGQMYRMPDGVQLCQATQLPPCNPAIRELQLKLRIQGNSPLQMGPQIA